MLKGEVLTGEGTSVADAAGADGAEGNKDTGLTEAIEKFKKDSKVWVESVEKGSI